MRRRDALLGVAAAAATLLPVAATAQQKAMPMIGFLSGYSPHPDADPFAVAFGQGLNDTGYIAGQTVTIEHRWAAGRYDQLPALAAELVGRNVDVMVTVAGFPGARAAQTATSTIPIVFLTGVDPVATGLVASLARPGGNLTGFTVVSVEVGPKRGELITQLLPQARVIAELVNPLNPLSAKSVEDYPALVRDEARRRGVQLSLVKASSESEINVAFETLVKLRTDALLVAADPFFTQQQDQLVALAARHAIPALYVSREFVAAGGLISYGPSLTEAFRQVGTYVGRILKGARPADLPVQQPTKFELVINLRTAKALGLSVPQSLLARADEVIE